MPSRNGETDSSITGFNNKKKKAPVKWEEKAVNSQVERSSPGKKENPSLCAGHPQQSIRTRLSSSSIPAKPQVHASLFVENDHAERLVNQL